MMTDDNAKALVTEEQDVASFPKLLLRAAVHLVFTFAIWGGLLFGAAGNVAWLRGWLHMGVWLVTFAVNAAILLRSNPAVFSARLRPKWSSERADTIILTLFLPVTLAVPVVAGLDAVRFNWSSLPIWTTFFGIAIHASGDAFVVWTMVANPFAEKTVRVQTERDHRVITTGPYAIVRHPMYLGVVLMFLAVPSMLGSAWAFAPVAVMALLLMIRSVLEERLLRRDLPGYAQYMAQTRWRIVPGIW